MNIRTTLFITLTILISLSGAAQADILAAGPVYGGPASVGGQITCRFFNYGGYNTSIVSRQIWANTGVAIPLSSDTCNVTLQPNKYCAFAASIGGNLAYSCRAIATGTDVKISGVAEVKNSSSNILNAVPIQK